MPKWDVCLGVKLVVTSKTQEFLDIVCAEIKYKKACTAIRKELRAHIEDHMFFLIKQCYFSAEEAEDEAIYAMGDPILLGQQLNQVHCRWKPILFQLLFSITWVLIFIILLFLIFIFLHNFYTF